MKHKSMREMRVVNYVKGKRIEDFSRGDTIYIQKIESGFTRNYFCSFISLNRGIVTAKVITADLFSKLNKGSIITTRKNKCYVWGNDGKLGHDHCIWFK